MTPLLGRQRRVPKYRIESDFVSQAVVVDSFHRETHDLHAGLRSETVDRGLVPQLGIHRGDTGPQREFFGDGDIAMQLESGPLPRIRLRITVMVQCHVEKALAGHVTTFGDLQSLLPRGCSRDVSVGGIYDRPPGSTSPGQHLRDR